MTQHNTKLDTLLHNFIDDVQILFHQKDINDTDEMYDYLHEYCDNAVIYTHECKEILQDNNMDYCFYDHECFGRPENIHQAAYVCLYDYITESDEFSDMYKKLEEKLEKV